MWITKPVTGSVDIIFRQQVNASNTVNFLWRGAAGAHGTDYLQLQLTNGGSGNYEYTAQSIFSVGWNHLVAVYDGSLTNANRIKIYLNGSVLSTTTVGTIPTTSATYTSENFAVGGQSGGANSINANIDEFRIYDYALTSGNITSIYNSGSPKADDLSTLAVHKYRVDDSTYPTIEDSGTGTATDLTMSNMESGDIDSDVPM
jgi:hypothetical protein